MLYRDATWILLETGALSSSEPRPVPSSVMRKTGRDMVTACTDPSLVPLLILLASFDCRDFVPSLQALQQYPLHMGSSQLPSDSPCQRVPSCHTSSMSLPPHLTLPHSHLLLPGQPSTTGECEGITPPWGESLTSESWWLVGKFHLLLYHLQTFLRSRRSLRAIGHT